MNSSWLGGGGKHYYEDLHQHNIECGMEVPQTINEVLLPKKGTKEANAHNHCFDFVGLVSVCFVC